MNIDREFIRWFYEEQYPELGSNRRQVYSTTHGTQDIDVIDYWMREAFKAGALAAQQSQKDPRYESESLR
jgi:ABC-type siderophore export system fused ATPase/permease subunit